MNNICFISSFDKSISEVVGASNIQNLRRQVGIFAQIHSVLFADVIAIVHQFLVQVVELIVSGYHTYT